MWKPGQSGNPRGRLRKKLVIEYLEEELEELAKTQGIENGTRLTAKKWAQLLFAGDRALWKEYLDRRDGAVKQQLGIHVDVASRMAELFYGEVMRPDEIEDVELSELPESTAPPEPE